jgi:hypothetical protein
MASMIDCGETRVNEMPGFHFTVSTVFLRKNELQIFDSLDGKSGFFPYKHHRRARTVFPYGDYQDNGEIKYDLEQSVVLTAKIAECGKLTKEERSTSLDVGPGSVGLLHYSILFLLAGLIFGLIMCPGLFLVCLIVGTPFVRLTSDDTYVEFVRFLLFDIPWLPLFLFCVVGFGLPMTIITALSKKKG